MSSTPKIARRVMAAAAAVVALGSVATPAAAASYTNLFSGLYVFGDSLSDNGNVYALTGGAAPVSPPYAQRFSDGPVGVEYMADALGLPLYDFAFGGAKTGFGNISPLLDGAAAAAGLSGTGVLAQIADFGTAQLGVADSAALYYISAGPNDFFEAPAVATIGTVVTNLTTAVTELYAMGARQFVLPSIADLGLTYASWQAEQVTPGAMAQASLLSAAANGALDAAYANLAAAMPDEMFYRIDTAAMQQAVLAQYTAIGGVTYTSSCLADGAVADCTGYMFFDDVHPTTDVHRIFGLATAEAVLVPEPSQWGLAAVALLAAGAATRRRARKPAASAA